LFCFAYFFALVCLLVPMMSLVIWSTNPAGPPKSTEVKKKHSAEKKKRKYICQSFHSPRPSLFSPSPSPSLDLIQSGGDNVHEFKSKKTNEFSPVALGGHIKAIQPNDSGFVRFSNT
jgi:hypothetical protein